MTPEDEAWFRARALAKLEAAGLQLIPGREAEMETRRLISLVDCITR